MTDLLSMFDELDENTRDPEEVLDDYYEIIRAPFGYPGSKNKSIKYILPHLPYTSTYVEPFGGSAAVLLARHESRLEIYNDRYGGVTSFYRAVKDPELFPKLMDWLDLSIHSREEWEFCNSTWRDVHDPLERAARWFYMTRFSFGQLGRNFGRTKRARSLMAQKVARQLPFFNQIHARFRNVQVENQDWRACIRDYDTPDTVFYMDPPYVDTSVGVYTHDMHIKDHKELLDRIFSCHGYVAVSGYSNPLYEEQDWDERYSWEVGCPIKSMAFTASNNKKGLEDVTEHKRDKAEEVLWVKRVR